MTREERETERRRRIDQRREERGHAPLKRQPRSVKHEWVMFNLDTSAGYLAGDLTLAMRAVYDGEHVPVINNVADTGTDDNWLCVSSRSITPRQVQRAFQTHMDSLERWAHDADKITI